MKKRAIVWFRQDLRLHDNEALTEALHSAQEVIPIYVFDPRVHLAETNYGFPKTGKFRAQFILESVADLQDNLRSRGSELIIRFGKPEIEIYKIARQVKSNWVFCNRERTYEEEKVQDCLERKLWTIGQEMRYTRGKLLYYTADLPFPVPHTPDIFTQFRKEVERYVPVREPLPCPETFPPSTVAIDSGSLPSLQELGHSPFEKDERAVVDFRGGEREGLKRLEYYLWETRAVKTYKKTRNGLIGSDYSTKFSPWLAQGCLSPKMIYHEIKRFEAEHGANKSTYWVIFELLWRDFFRFMAKKHGNLIFQLGGTKEDEVEVPKTEDIQLLERWIQGKTGVPFIDANMREIRQTGYMSNRGRQNVASFLVKDLKLNWLMGAEYFESQLIDYDVASNYGNWNYVAGVGSDPRENRYFNILSQAKRYDPNGEYVKLWLPELTYLPAAKVHTPDRLSRAEQEEHHVFIGADYPKAMVSTARWR